MLRRMFCPLAVALIFTGCVPVTTPLSDPTKAEPDLELIGEWSDMDHKFRTESQRAFPRSLIIDVPQVKGNPKGLMRVDCGEGDAVFFSKVSWFFTTKIDKHNYVTVFLGPNRETQQGGGFFGPAVTLPLFADFKSPGEFEKFAASEKQSYRIMKYRINGDKLVLDIGNAELFGTIIRDEKIDSIEIPGNYDPDHNKFFQYAKTPKNWLANYLRKNGPEKIFDGTNTIAYKLLGRNAAAYLFPGGLRVTEAFSDISKAELDKALIGKWECEGGKGTYEIDTPVVSGNPKGLMRAVGTGKQDTNNTFWFSATKIGKHSYATIYIDAEGAKFADFLKDGEFENLAKLRERKYLVVKYSVDGDKLALDRGGESAAEYLMNRERITQLKTNGFFLTPEGWLSSYLTKNGPSAIYDGMQSQDYRRVKK